MPPKTLKEAKDRIDSNVKNSTLPMEQTIKKLREAGAANKKSGRQRHNAAKFAAGVHQERRADGLETSINPPVPQTPKSTPYAFPTDGKYPNEIRHMKRMPKPE